MDIVEEMRGFEIDHEPEGWPGVRMRQVSALCDEIDRLRTALKISTNGLRHCARWNISDEKEKALMTVVMENEALLKTPNAKLTGLAPEGDKS